MKSLPPSEKRGERIEKQESLPLGILSKAASGDSVAQIALSRLAATGASSQSPRPIDATAFAYWLHELVINPKLDREESALACHVYSKALFYGLGVSRRCSDAWDYNKRALDVCGGCDSNEMIKLYSTPGCLREAFDLLTRKINAGDAIETPSPSELWEDCIGFWDSWKDRNLAYDDESGVLGE